jgi:hypothetical protein
MFDYDRRAPLGVKEHSVEEREGAKVYDITYASPQGGRVTAYLVAPASNGRHAGIIFAHPGGGDRKVFLPEALTLARVGAVSLLIDDPSARPAAWRRRMFVHAEPENDRAAYIQAIIDLRRGVDLLAARPDVDAKRLGFVGFSFGADLGGILTGVERRIKAYALMGTGARLTDLWRSGDTPNLARDRRGPGREPGSSVGKYDRRPSARPALMKSSHVSHGERRAIALRRLKTFFTHVKTAVSPTLPIHVARH